MKKRFNQLLLLNIYLFHLIISGFISWFSSHSMTGTSIVIGVFNNGHFSWSLKIDLRRKEHLSQKATWHENCAVNILSYLHQMCTFISRKFKRATELLLSGVAFRSYFDDLWENKAFRPQTKHELSRKNVFHIFFLSTCIIANQTFKYWWGYHGQAFDTFNSLKFNEYEANRTVNELLRKCGFGSSP